MLRASEKRLRLGQRLPDILHARPQARYYREYVLKLGPVAYWPMNDLSGLPVDVSGNSRDMTAVNGSPTYGEQGPMSEPTVGYPSGAYHERAVVSTRVNDFAVCFWIYRDGTPTANGDIFTHGTTSGGFQIEWNTTNGTIRANLPSVGTLANFATLSNQTWTFIVCGKNTGVGGTWLAGPNGTLASSGTAAPGTPVGNTRVGGQVSTQTRLSHVAFFDRMLTQNEVSTLYQIGTRVVVPLL